MGAILEIQELRRRFGSLIALDGLTFTLPKDSTVAFVGANGAGKTTTFSVIAQFIRSHGGSVRIDGMSLSAYRANGGAIGLLPQDMQFFEHRTVRRQLILFAALSGMSSREAQREAERVLDLVALSDRANARVDELSRGMRVRLGTAQALVGDPGLVLLDEPMAGLDPKMRATFRESIQALKGSTTLVLSSHELQELQSLCDYVCIIDAGKAVQCGPIQEVVGGPIRIRYILDSEPDDSRALKDLLPGGTIAIREEQGRKCLEVVLPESSASVAETNKIVLAWLLERDIPILSVDSSRSLEEAYLQSV